jgi:hypothetical protein
MVEEFRRMWIFCRSMAREGSGRFSDVPLRDTLVSKCRPKSNVNQAPKLGLGRKSTYMVQEGRMSRSGRF